MTSKSRKSRWSGWAAMVLGMVLLVGLFVAGCGQFTKDLTGVNKDGQLTPLDVVNPDGDFVTPGNQTSVDLGNVAPGAVLTTYVSFQLVCTGNKHVDNGQTVNITFFLGGSTVPTGGSLSATNASIGPIPAAWPDDTTGPSNCGTPSPTPLEDNGDSTVTITAPSAAGPYTYKVRYNHSLTPAGSNDAASITGVVEVTYTLTVIADTTPPVITFTGTPANAHGWNNTDVTVSWSVTDSESAISSSSGCDTVVVTDETSGTTYTCTATSAGGTSSQSVTVKIDKTKPTASANASPAANANGWNNTNVTVSFSGSDALSGIDFCDAPVVLSSEGAGQSASGTCTDKAGNVSDPATASGINIDKTPPSVSVTGVTDGATYTLGSVPTAGCNTTDALSGVQTPAAVSVSGGPVVGTFTATCSGAVDNADNPQAAPVSVSYTVQYNFIGFLSPVDNPPTFNVGKAGRTIPVKWQLPDGNGGYISSLDVVLFNPLRYRQINCNTSAPQDPLSDADTSGSSGLRYDFTANQYIFTWQTSSTFANKCYELLLDLNDGTQKIARFKFTK